MVKIHVAGDGHVTPLGRHTWDPYADAKKKKVVEDAIFILTNNIKGYKPCNDCFSALPNGRTFDSLLADNTIFISYDPSKVKNDWGATIGDDITITDFSIGVGKWTVAATLVHELAHVNGAGGADTAAEDTLNCCKLNGLHNPNVIGALPSSPGSRYA